MELPSARPSDLVDTVTVSAGRYIEIPINQGTPMNALGVPIVDLGMACAARLRDRGVADRRVRYVVRIVTIRADRRLVVALGPSLSMDAVIDDGLLPVTYNTTVRFLNCVLTGGVNFQRIMGDRRDLGVTENALQVPCRMDRVVPQLFVDTEIEGIAGAEHHWRSGLAVTREACVVVPIEGLLGIRAVRPARDEHDKDSSHHNEAPDQPSHRLSFIANARWLRRFQRYGGTLRPNPALSVVAVRPDPTRCDLFSRLPPSSRGVPRRIDEDQQPDVPAVRS